jgi:hypothetical protein
MKPGTPVPSERTITDAAGDGPFVKIKGEGDDALYIKVPAERAASIRRILAYPLPLLNWLMDVYMPDWESHRDSPTVERIEALMETMPPEVRAGLSPDWRDRAAASDAAFAAGRGVS